MCKFFSGIIQPEHNGVWFDENIDSHSELCEKFGIRDKMPRANFVKFEITPKDGDICNHAPKNWVYAIDEDHKGQIGIPDWYDAEKGEKQARAALIKVLAKVTACGLVIDEIEYGRRIRKAKNCDIKKLYGQIDILESSTVGEMRESSKVGEMWASSTVGEMRESSKVGVMWASSTVGVMLESSTVGEMWESSTVGVMRASSKVGEMRESSKVGEMWASSTVGEMRESSTVGVMLASSTVGEMWDNSHYIKYENGDIVFFCANKKAKLEIVK
jgi:hypothetical protein